MIKKIIKNKTTEISKKQYIQVLTNIIQQIQEAQVEAFVMLNQKLNMLHWNIGKTIVEKQKEYGWGSNFVEKIAEDLQNRLPGRGGFSRANVFKMKSFYETYEKSLTAVRQIESLPIFNIPWGHNVILITKLDNNNERIWYAQKSLEYGWSRSILDTWIKSDLYNREGKAITNFQKTLPKPQSDMAQQSFKDPYIFDFLTLQKEHLEFDLELGLIDHIQKLLLELGKGFAFVGRQYHLQISNKDFYLDLLFYHYKLRCFIVVELKAKEFEARDAGQINLYLSAVDDLLRLPEDNPTIGLILCKTKDNVLAEYALRDLNKPIGVAGYETELIKKLPKELKSSLPTIEEIEAELEKKGILSEIEREKRKKNIIKNRKKH